MQNMKIDITLNMNGNDITLTLEEAQQLYKELDKLFGVKSNPYVPYPSTSPWQEPYIGPKKPFEITYTDS